MGGDPPRSAYSVTRSIHLPLRCPHPSCHAPNGLSVAEPLEEDGRSCYCSLRLRFTSGNGADSLPFLSAPLVADRIICSLADIFVANSTPRRSLFTTP